MARTWLRRAGLVAATATALLLAACGGSSTIESQLKPTRVVAFGDATADMGVDTTVASNQQRYTINDGTPNIWTRNVAGAYSLDLLPVAAGGTSYAQGNARVLTEPDAAGSTATLTVKEQVDAFLANRAFTSTDLVLVSAGTSDVIAEMSRYTAGLQTREQMLDNVGQAGRDLGAQVRRMVDAGAQQVAVAGPYNLGRSSLAVQYTAQAGNLEAASSRFNEQFLVSVVDLGRNVLYVDQAFFFNLVTATPTAYGFTNGTDPVCTSIDPGPGIGAGANQPNSKLCNTSTLAANATTTSYLFADRIYMTPTANRLFGDWAYEKIRQRF